MSRQACGNDEPHLVRHDEAVASHESHLAKKLEHERLEAQNARIRSMRVYSGSDDRRSVRHSSGNASELRPTRNRGTARSNAAIAAGRVCSSTSLPKRSPA